MSSASQLHSCVTPRVFTPHRRTLRAPVLPHVSSLESRTLLSAVTFDPAAEWSWPNNPNGAWSYGWSESLGSAFELSTGVVDVSGISGHTPDLFGTKAPLVSHNDTAGTVSIGTVIWPPDGIILHPGPGGEIAVLRFTAPSDGTFAVSGNFTSQDIFGATTDVHVLHNGAAVFDGEIGTEQFIAFSESFAGAAGDTIDVAVGFGNGSYSFDSTGLEATITMDPHDCTIPGLVEQVEALVAEGILNAGQGNAFTATLLQASEKLDDGKLGTALNQLEAFVNKIDARLFALDENDTGYEAASGKLQRLKSCALELIDSLSVV
jgi:hypothetical protein